MCYREKNVVNKRMAYASSCDTSALQNAMLQVWTPAVGVRSLDEMITRNIEKLEASFGLIGALPYYMGNMPNLQMMVIADTCFDDRPPFEMKEKILSGSWSEGLFFYGHSNTSIPDLDFMYVLKHISFSKEDQQSGTLTLKEDTPFVYAYLKDKHAVKMWKAFLVEDAGKKQLSSKKLKERLHKNYNRSQFLLIGEDSESDDVGNGAAMCVGAVDLCNEILRNFDIPSLIPENWKQFYKGRYKILTGSDVVLAISCDGWPFCAREWITRDRNWPQDDLIQKIINDGFHIVPKSSSDGDFRLSFSYAETTLIENLTELQHKILRSFKAVVKYHQNTWSPNIKEILSTYHLKTTAFWYFESNSPDSFTEKTAASNLIILLQKLATSLRNRELPMYFMPKVNLLGNIENPEEAVDIAEQIELLSNDLPCLVKGLENITTGFAWECGMINSFLKLADEIGIRQPYFEL